MICPKCGSGTVNVARQLTSPVSRYQCVSCLYQWEESPPPPPPPPFDDNFERVADYSPTLRIGDKVYETYGSTIVTNLTEEQAQVGTVIRVGVKSNQLPPMRSSAAGDGMRAIIEDIRKADDPHAKARIWLTTITVEITKELG